MEIPRAKEDVRTPSVGGVSVPSTPVPSFGEIRIPTGDLTRAAGAMSSGSDQLMSMLRVHGKQMDDENMLREIVGAEGQYMDASRRAMLEVADMRGQAQALPDEMTGEGGIYNVAKQRTDELVDKAVGQYTGRYATALEAKLRSHQANTLNAAASMEAQEREWDFDRKAGLVIDQYGQQVATSRGDRLQTYLALNQGVDSLATLYGVDPNSTDPAKQGRWSQYVTAKNRFVTHIAQQAIFSSMDVIPAEASGHLERFGPYIDQQSAHVLKGMVEKAAKEKSAEDTYRSMQGIPFAEQARLVGLITDLDVRSRVSTLITADEHRKQASLASTIHAAEEGYQAKINAAKVDPEKWGEVKVTDILKDKRLDERARGQLMDKVLGRKPTEAESMARLEAKTRIMDAVARAPELYGRTDILQAAQSMGLDSQSAEEVMRWGEHAAGPLSFDIKRADDQIDTAFGRSMLDSGTPEQSQAKFSAKASLHYYLQNAKEQGVPLEKQRETLLPENVSKNFVLPYSRSLNQQLDAMKARSTRTDSTPASPADTGRGLAGGQATPPGNAPVQVQPIRQQARDKSGRVVTFQLRADGSGWDIVQ